MKKVFLISFIFLHQAYAHEIEGKLATFRIELKKDYQLHKNFLGLPYVFIKKESPDFNSSLSVTPTGLEAKSLDMDVLKKKYDQYKNGRKKWALKNRHTISKFYPFNYFENNSKAKITESGYEYKKSNGEENAEKSYYVLCPKEMFHLKLLTNKKFMNDKISTLEKALKNSTCKTN
jgi:hypothetical protein